jgi:hypothetical protein
MTLLGMDTASGPVFLSFSPLLAPDVPVEDPPGAPPAPPVKEPPARGPDRRRPPNKEYPPVQEPPNAPQPPPLKAPPDPDIMDDPPL